MSSANSFGTFLETRQLLRSQSQQQQARSAGADESPQIAAAVKILEAPLPAPGHELLKSSGLPMATFFETLSSLQSEGLVELRKGDDGELVHLTDRGRDLLTS